MNKLVKFLRDEEGATAVEYGLIAVFLGVGIITALMGLRGTLRDLFNNIATQIAGANH